MNLETSNKFEVLEDKSVSDPWKEILREDAEKKKRE